MSKSFPLRFGHFAETQKLVFRAEAFNLFNHANFQQSGQYHHGPYIWRDSKTAKVGGDPRILQLALRFSF